MVVSLNVYAYCKFWNTPSTVVKSLINEPSVPISLFNFGANGFTQLIKK